ncbi:MAG: tRNA lysidine(34) synthetase TilS [Thermodesulfobacteriota bacterium]
MNRCSGIRDIVPVVRRTIVDHGMISPGDTVVTAVSGGPDSVALLRILYLLSTDLRFSIIVAHVDHKLRPESAQDALFVENVSEDLGLEVVTTEADVHSTASLRRRGLEEAGRRVRYEFFQEIVASRGANRIATAHHADDAIETFFLRLLTGAGTTGLTGIAPVRGNIVRPLIRCFREEILAFLEKEGISYRVDTTNLLTDTDRNFMRNAVIPLIGTRFPGFRKPLLRTLDLIEDDRRSLQGLISDLVNRGISRTPGETVIDVPVFQKAPSRVAGKALLEVLYSIPDSDERWTKAHVDGILRIIHGDNPSAQMDLPGGMVLAREYDRLRLFRGAPAAATDFHIEVSGEGRCQIQSLGMVLEFLVTQDKGTGIENAAAWAISCFDADVADFPLVLRPPRPGDRFHPQGFSGTRKLKKVLIDHKVPLRLRRRLPLLVKDDHILWIPRVRQSSFAAVTPRTKRILTVRIVDPGEVDNRSMSGVSLSKRFAPPA